MAAGNFYLPFVPVQSGNGFVVPGALVTFYDAGTTTKVTVYADEGRTTPLPNPVQADAAGKLPAIYLADGLYHVTIADADGALINDIDPYAPGEYAQGPAGPSAIDIAWTQEFVGAAGQSTFTTDLDFAPGGVVVVVGISRLRPQDFTTLPSQRRVILNTPLAISSYVTISAFDPSSSGEGGGAGPGADTTIRPELAAPTGASLVATNAAGNDAVTRDLRQRGRDSVNVLDYIPTSLHAAIRNYTSTTDIAPFASAAYSQNQGATVYWPRGRYYIGSTVNTNSCHSIGDGYNNTMVYAAASGVTVFRLVGQNCQFRGFQIMGNGLGAVAIFCFNSNTSQIAGCWIDGFSLAGIKFGITGNQNETVMSYNVVRNCGRRIDCGTATANAGATSISTNVNPTALGIRLGVDFVKVGTAPANEITGFTSNSISFFPPLESSQSSQAVKILQGSCLEIGRHGDNSDLKSINNTFQNGALAGIDDLALYGVQSIGDTRESNGYGRVIGRAVGGGEQVVIHWIDQGTYSENNTENAGIYHGSSNFYDVNNPVVDQIGNGGLDWMRIASSATLRAGRVQLGGRIGYRKSELINPSTLSLAVGDIVMVRGLGQTFTLTLNTPTSPNARGVASLFNMPALCYLGAVNGNTVNVNATGGALVNDQSSISLTPPRGTRLEAYYTTAGTWEVFAL